MNKVQPYLKALLGFLAPGATAIGFAVTEGSAAGERITQGEWIAAIVACVVTGGLVFTVPNKDPQALHQDESVQPPERGYTGVVWALLVVLLVILILVFAGRL